MLGLPAPGNRIGLCDFRGCLGQATLPTNRITWVDQPSPGASIHLINLKKWCETRRSPFSTSLPLLRQLERSSPSSLCHSIHSDCPIFF